MLAVQDTTSLSYSTHAATEGLGPMGSRAQGPLGLWLHCTLAFNLEGTPLGLLEVQCGARHGARLGKKQQRKQPPLEEKESFKGLKSFPAACEKLCWYTLRWGIEVYHRTLKSGCQIEQRQLGTADSIEALGH